MNICYSTFNSRRKKESTKQKEKGRSKEGSTRKIGFVFRLLFAFKMMFGYIEQQNQKADQKKKNLPVDPDPEGKTLLEVCICHIISHNLIILQCRLTNWNLQRNM
jgi:hypothetical protein